MLKLKKIKCNVAHFLDHDYLQSLNSIKIWICGICYEVFLKSSLNFLCLLEINKHHNIDGYPDHVPPRHPLKNTQMASEWESLSIEPLWRAFAVGGVFAALSVNLFPPPPKLLLHKHFVALVM